MCIIFQFINSVDIVNIHIYLMLKNNEKKFCLVKQVFIGVFKFCRSLVTKFISLKNEPSITRPMLSSIH